MLTVQMYIPGNDERSRLLRRVLVRRVLLMLTLLLRSISRSVRRRFPTLQDLVKQGFLKMLSGLFYRVNVVKFLFCYLLFLGVMTRTEKQCYESISPVVNLYWVPSTWFTSALNEAVKEGFLTDSSGNKLIMEVTTYNRHAQ